MWKKIILSSFVSIFISFILCFIYYNYIYYFFATPELTLKGQVTETITLGTNYIEPGYEVKIGQKDVNNNVAVSNNVNNQRIGTYEVEYIVKNKIGSRKTIQVRKIIVVDEEKPLISLVGNNITISKDSDYKEPGYIAVDNYDGDITNKVAINNTVNINKIGTYYVVYTVKDSSGNEASISRRVDVVKSSVIAPKGSGIGVPVLMYHFFYDSSLGEKGKDNSNWMDISKFDEEMKYLKDNNYYFPSWNELEQYIDGGLTLPSKSVIVTIDDGNESFFRLAYPVLKKYEVKATSFIVTSWTNINNYNIDRTLISFESHSSNMHRGTCEGGHGGIFQCIDYNDGYNDLEASINMLNSNEVFCYPFGDYNDRDIQMLKDVGFKMAVTTKYGKVKVGMNKLLLPRVRIQGYYKINDFINAIE